MGTIYDGYYPQAMMTRTSIQNKPTRARRVTDNNEPTTVGQLAVHFDLGFQYITRQVIRPTPSVAALHRRATFQLEWLEG